MTNVFQVDRLCKSFGGLAVSRNLSFSMKTGDRVALIGPNGAGKTTFVNLVTGSLKPDSGAIWLSGENVTARGVIARVRRGLVRSYQIPRLFQEMTCLEHMAFCILQREGRSGRMFGSFWEMPHVIAEAMEFLASLGLDRQAHQKACEIAYGQQRLLEIALVLALKPKVLLLDEPAAGVSQSGIERIVAALDGLPQTLAALMIDHDMDLVFRFAKRVVALAAGEIIFDGSPSEAAKDRRVREAYLGSYADVGGNA